MPDNKIAIIQTPPVEISRHGFFQDEEDFSKFMCFVTVIKEIAVEIPRGDERKPRALEELWQQKKVEALKLMVEELGVKIKEMENKDEN